MIHGAKPGQVRLGSPNSDEAQFDMNSLPEEFCDRAHCSRGVALRGQVPEGRPSPRIESARFRSFDKSFDSDIVGRSEKERFVKFARAGKLGRARPQPSIFRNLTKAHMMEARHTDRAFLRNLIKRLADLGVRPSLCNPQVTPDALHPWDLQAEVAIRKEDSAAIFRNEWVIVAKLFADRFNFLARAVREQNVGDFPPVELIKRLFRACKGVRARINQCAFERGKDQMARGKQDINQCNLPKCCREAG